MSDDLPNSDVADQLHDDLFVKRLTDSDNTEFSNDLEKRVSVDEVPKTAFRRVFLQPRQMEVYEIPISEKQLDSIPAEERIFFIQIGHLANELSTLNQVVAFCIKQQWRH
jgi:hypothetical protein